MIIFTKLVEDVIVFLFESSLLSLLIVLEVVILIVALSLPTLSSLIVIAFVISLAAIALAALVMDEAVGFVPIIVSIVSSSSAIHILIASAALIVLRRMEEVTLSICVFLTVLSVSTNWSLTSLSHYLYCLLKLIDIKSKILIFIFLN